MKLQVKTADRHTYTVSISEFRTVGELKIHVCKLRGPWMRPDTQQILYGGQVLDDKKRLRIYCIDERKFLLMLPRSKQKRSEKCSSPDQTTVDEGNKDEMKKTDCVEKKQASTLSKRILLRLGKWKEKEVRQALLVSMYNPQRAIEYLEKGIKLFPNMVTPPSSNLSISKLGSDKSVEESAEFDSSDDECDNKLLQKAHVMDITEQNTISEKIIQEDFNSNSSHEDPFYTDENSTLTQTKDVHDDSFKRGNPDENSTLAQPKDVHDDSFKRADPFQNLENILWKKPLNNVKTLVTMGFPRERAVEAFLSSGGNIESAVNILLGEREFQQN